MEQEAEQPECQEPRQEPRQEPSQSRSRHSWNWIKHYRWPVLCVTFGGLMAALGLKFEDLEKLKTTGTGSAIWGVVLWLVERSSSRTGAEVSRKIDTATPQVAGQVADQVADRIWVQMDSVQRTLNETSTTVMRLSNQISSTEKTRQRDHEQNLSKTGEIGTEVHQIKSKLDAHGEAITDIKAVVKSLKPDWTPKPH
jgi:hypothetical protein